MCGSKGAHLFIEVETKQHQEMKDEKFMKLNKL